MVYLLDDLNHIPDEIIRETFALMPPERQERAARYRREKDKKLCVMAFWLLMYGLKKEYGIEEQLSFSYRAYGKPLLTDYPSIFFNLSHCEYGIVCVISNCEVGIDIQDIRPYSPAVAKRVCTASELERLEKSDEPDVLFCRFWAIKESYIKQKGISILYDLSSLSADAIVQSCGKFSFLYNNEKCWVCCLG